VRLAREHEPGAGRPQGAQRGHGQQHVTEGSGVEGQGQDGAWSSASAASWSRAFVASAVPV
jgi:hypothetical protein